MELMGMGLPELGVILLVAFLVLGPGKTIEMARTVGKVVRDIRRVSNEIISAVDLGLDEKPKQPQARIAPPDSRVDSSPENRNEQP